VLEGVARSRRRSGPNELVRSTSAAQVPSLASPRLVFAEYPPCMATHHLRASTPLPTLL
jgi:hypothetical protein